MCVCVLENEMNMIPWRCKKLHMPNFPKNHSKHFHFRSFVFLLPILVGIDSLEIEKAWRKSWIARVCNVICCLWCKQQSWRACVTHVMYECCEWGFWSACKATKTPFKSENGWDAYQHAYAHGLQSTSTHIIEFRGTCPSGYSSAKSCMWLHIIS